MKWKSFFLYRSSQNNHSTAGYILAMTCMLPDKIDLLFVPLVIFLSVQLEEKKKKKAAKRAILSAVMNNEASVITSDSEGAHGVCPHIHQQPSGGLMYL